jgi:hypothetical protein
MTWVIPWSRRSARIKRVDDDDADDDYLINGFLCDAAIRALVLGCPACGRCTTSRRAIGVRACSTVTGSGFGAAAAVSRRRCT